MNIPTTAVEMEVLASTLRNQQLRLKEMLDAIEKRDISPSQVRVQLGWMAEGLTQMRKASAA